MAAALTRAHFPQQIYCRSAGVAPGQNDPFVAEIMLEIGVDLGMHQPHTYESLEDSYFDLIITMAPEAHHHVLAKTAFDAVRVEYWPTVDPSVTQGSRAQILSAYRLVRDSLLDRIKDRFQWRSMPGH